MPQHAELQLMQDPQGAVREDAFHASVPRAARLTTILLVARLVTDRGDHLCRVRNVSVGGMMIECDVALAPRERIRVELRNMNAVEGTVAWARSPRAGVRFDAPVDVGAILHAAAGPQGLRPRAPRVSAACPVLVWHEGRSSGRRLRDLSQSGCRLSFAGTLPVGTELRLTIPGLPPRHAQLRWARGDEAGFAFREMLSFAELSAWQRDHGTRFADLAVPADSGR